MPIVWTTDLSVGVDAIDNQHKELFARVNKLLDACSLGKGKETLGEIMDFLQDYVSTHFQAEEEYMAKNHYPAYLEHKTQHEEFIKAFLELKREIETEGASSHIVIKTNRVVVNWLNQHIRNTDKILGQFLLKKQE